MQDFGKPLIVLQFSHNAIGYRVQCKVNAYADILTCIIFNIIASGCALKS